MNQNWTSDSSMHANTEVRLLQNEIFISTQCPKLLQLQVVLTEELEMRVVLNNFLLIKILDDLSMHTRPVLRLLEDQ